ncbi:MAG: fasciclin domain-containing protein [Burkholderiaceae bacterium]
MNKRALLCAASAAVLAMAGCASMSGSKTVAQTAASTPSLSTLNRLIVEAGLSDTLNGTGPYTVFAPTDDAFKAVPAKALADLAKDKEQLKAVLAYHVVPGKVSAEQLRNGPVKSVQGAPVNIAKAGSFITVEDAVVTQPDVAASNGVVHLVDKVLMPPKR